MIRRVIVQSANHITILNSPLVNPTTIEVLRESFAAKCLSVLAIGVDIVGTALVTVSGFYRP